MATIDENRAQWTNYEWAEGGDEWSACWGRTEFLWYGTIFPRIHGLLPTDNILEIAPGFGRCTQYLLLYCQHLTVVDLTEKCIKACQKRFASSPHIKYIINDGKSLEMLEDNSIDFVFSWDSLVHAESDVLHEYLRYLSFKLKPGGFGFIHHSNIGTFKNLETGKLSVQNLHWRADSMSAELFGKYCRDVGLTCISQELINWGDNILNDCFSLFTREDTKFCGNSKPVIIENTDFMLEAPRAKRLSELYDQAFLTNKRGTSQAYQHVQQPNVDAHHYGINNNNAGDKNNTILQPNTISVITEHVIKTPQSKEVTTMHTGQYINSLLEVSCIETYEAYRNYTSSMGSRYEARQHIEHNFLQGKEVFTVQGMCYVCNEWVNYLVDYQYSYKVNGQLVPNWRERLECPKCGLNNRMRAAVQFFEELLHPYKVSPIYLTEQTTLLYRWFKNNYANTIGSEYLSDTAFFGMANSQGIRNESLTSLSFPSQAFDFVVSFDVFEYIPDFKNALNECYRILGPNGVLFFTVPFDKNSEKNIIKAVINSENKIEYLLPPEYHGYPLKSEGCLSYYQFGWELLEQLREIGFTNVRAYLYWSREMGYLGGEQILFVAEKTKKIPAAVQSKHTEISSAGDANRAWRSPQSERKASFLENTGYCPTCANEVTFVAKDPWLRDHYICSNCGSIPRERALMRAIEIFFPDWRNLTIHESSPINRGASLRLALECKTYIPSQYFPNAKLGDVINGVRCENLEALTFLNESIDLHITQDVMEHIYASSRVFCEIARSLKQGGAHVFTVPLVNKNKPSTLRARRTDDGQVVHLEPPVYHGNPVNDDGSLVTVDWGFDICRHIFESCGLFTYVLYMDDLSNGIRAEYIEVLITVNPNAAKQGDVSPDRSANDVHQQTSRYHLSPSFSDKVPCGSSDQYPVVQSCDIQPSIERRQDIKSNKSGLICLHPFHFIQIFYDKIYPCCPDWTKYSIGNIRQQSIAESWNSETARYIRRKMYKGEWEDICNPCCPYIATHRLTGQLISYENLEKYDCLTPELVEEIRNGNEYLKSSPTGFKIDNANTCNINCIMCSRNAHADDPVLIKKTDKEVFKYLPGARVVELTGNGDPFAIKHTKEWLFGDYRYNPHLKFNLITNALLLPNYWDKIKHQRFGSLLISIDAATKETYGKIRVGGSWDTLQRSLSLIKDNRKRFESVTLNMTVMRHNYQEIPAFIAFAESYGFNVSFQRLRGMYGNQNIFEMNDVDALNELRNIIKNIPIKTINVNVFWGDIIEFAQSGG